jgi:hypothetical protein
MALNVADFAWLANELALAFNFAIFPSGSVTTGLFPNPTIFLPADGEYLLLSDWNTERPMPCEEIELLPFAVYRGPESRVSKTAFKRSCALQFEVEVLACRLREQEISTSERE